MYCVHIGAFITLIQIGANVETKKNKKQLSGNPKVLTLTTELFDHEWREAC